MRVLTAVAAIGALVLLATLVTFIALRYLRRPYPIASRHARRLLAEANLIMGDLGVHPELEMISAAHLRQIGRWSEKYHDFVQHMPRKDTR